MNFFSISGLTISIISLLLGIYNFFKRISDEKFRIDCSVFSVTAANGIPPEIGVTYIELTVTNKSTMPIPIIDAFLRVKISDHFIKDPVVKNGNIIEAHAYRYNTLISTRTTGDAQNREIQFERKSNGLPITIPPKDSRHFILAFHTPYVLDINEKTDLHLELHSHTPHKIFIKNEELLKHVKTITQFKKERTREI